MWKWTKFRLFSPHLCLGKHNSNVERNDIWIYVKVILFVCGQGFYFGQVSFCPGFLLSVGLWGEEPIMREGEIDLKGACEMCWVSVWKPASDTNHSLSVVDAWRVKWTQREDEDGCLKSRSLQWRRSLLSIILSIPVGSLLLKAFFWRLLLRDWEPLLMEALAQVGNPGKLLPKAGQASCGDVVATSPHLNRVRSLLGKEMGVFQWTSEGRDFPRQKGLVTHRS